MTLTPNEQWTHLMPCCSSTSGNSQSASRRCTNLCMLAPLISIQKHLKMDYLQGKHPQTVVILLGNSDNGDLDTLVSHSVLGPVFCTFLKHITPRSCVFSLIHRHHRHRRCRVFGWTHLIFFLQVGDHHDDRAPFLPNHPPEVAHCVDGGSLGCNVGTVLVPITLSQKTCYRFSGTTYCFICLQQP